jgi:hypothetical protein
MQNHYHKSKSMVTVIRREREPTFLRSNINGDVEEEEEKSCKTVKFRRGGTSTVSLAMGDDIYEINLFRLTFPVSPYGQTFKRVKRTCILLVLAAKLDFIQV